MTTICFISVTDSSRKQRCEVEPSQSADFETCPGVVSPGGGGCDIQLQILAISLSPVQGLD